MVDKSWLLNPAAIRVAKKCIQSVQDELGVKLKLSHPEFMQMLHEYVELTDSEELGTSYSELLSFIGVGKAVQGLAKKEETKVIPISNQQVVNGFAEPEFDVPMVEYRGKQYPMWNDGKKFKGLYRGQPHYG